MSWALYPNISVDLVKVCFGFGSIFGIGHLGYLSNSGIVNFGLFFSILFYPFLLYFMLFYLDFWFCGIGILWSYQYLVVPLRELTTLGFGLSFLFFCFVVLNFILFYSILIFISSLVLLYLGNTNIWAWLSWALTTLGSLISSSLL